MTLTILVANRRVCKTWTRTEAGWTGTAYPRIYRWITRNVIVENLDALAHELECVAAYGCACVIRGVPIGEHGETPVRRLTRPCMRTGEPATFRSAPDGLRWICVDVDGVPTDVDPATHPDEYAESARCALAPVLARGRCWYQLSASAGIKPGARVHLWYWLERAAHDDALRAWAEPAYGVDASLFGAVQPHYLVAPTFDEADPLSQRTGWLDGTQSVWPDGLLDLDQWAWRQAAAERRRNTRAGQMWDAYRASDAHADSAVSASVREIIGATSGNRNATICRKANFLGRVCAKGALDMTTAQHELERAAQVALGDEWGARGRTVVETITRCLTSGFNDG